MKRKIVQATLLMISLATVFVVVVPAVHAAETCSNTKAAGDWGFTLNGTLIFQQVPFLARRQGGSAQTQRGTSLARRPGMWVAASPTRLSLDRGR